MTNVLVALEPPLLPWVPVLGTKNAGFVPLLPNRACVAAGRNGLFLYYRNNPFLPAATQALLGNNGTNPAFFVPSTGTQGNNGGSNATNTFVMGKFLDGGPTQEQGERSVNRLLSISAGLDGHVGGYSW